MDVHISGFGGGSFAGSETISSGSAAAKTFDSCKDEIFNYYQCHLGNAFREEGDRTRLYKGEFSYLAAASLRQSFDETFEAYREQDPRIIADSFNLFNRYQKMFTWMIKAERDHFEDRCPFLDFDFLTFILTVPAEHKAGRKLQLGMLDSYLPSLTTVPWQLTADYPTLLPHQTYQPPEGETLPTEPGRNYPLWLSTYGKDWAHDLLDSDRLEARGIFDRAYLRSLLELHPVYMKEKSYEEQRNLTYRIGTIASLELMFRQVLDFEE